MLLLLTLGVVLTWGWRWYEHQRRLDAALMEVVGEAYGSSGPYIDRVRVLVQHGANPRMRDEHETGFTLLS